MHKIRTGKTLEVKVIDLLEHKKYISDNDAEMDARAQKAVSVAVEKAKFCQKPIAKYDPATKKAYLEYADGNKKYVN